MRCGQKDDPLTLLMHHTAWAEPGRPRGPPSSLPPSPRGSHNTHRWYVGGQERDAVTSLDHKPCVVVYCAAWPAEPLPRSARRADQRVQAKAYDRRLRHARCHVQHGRRVGRQEQLAGRVLRRAEAQPIPPAQEEEPAPCAQEEEPAPGIQEGAPSPQLIWPFLAAPALYERRQAGPAIAQRVHACMLSLLWSMVPSVCFFHTLFHEPNHSCP